MIHPEPEYAAGWAGMTRLVEIVRGGGSLPSVAPTVVLVPGETQHGSLVAECQVFCGTDVSYESGYSVSGGLLFMAAGIAIGEANNARARRQAEAMARPQWRPAGPVPVVVTSRRLLIMLQGQWAIIPFDRLVAMIPAPQQWVLELHLEGEAPLMLRGPWVPWLAVVLCVVLYGQPDPPGAPSPPALGPGHGGPA